jgi:hypothetical protein
MPFFSTGSPIENSPALATAEMSEATVIVSNRLFTGFPGLSKGE